jgi:hypothetical protein
MKAIAKLALALATVGSCATSFAMMGDQADQERRARNREEAVAKWERMQADRDHDRTYDRRYDDRADYRDHHDHRTVGQKVEHAGNKTEHFLQRQGHKAENFTERQMDKVRNFGERQQDKFHGPAHPTREDDKRPAAMGK